MSQEDEVLKVYEDLLKYAQENVSLSGGKLVRNPWRIEPITFKEFCASPDHMQFPWLSERQIESAMSVLHDDPKKIFDPVEKKFKISCCLWGKGGGKDNLASMVICYIVYVLLCLERPYDFLTGFDVKGASIDIVNVAYSFEQASNVFFDILRNKIKNWKWLRELYRVRESQRDLDPFEKGKINPKPVVTIYPAGIRFPHNIRVFSRHSQSESTEGLNILAWVMDEASAFRDSAQVANADKLYSMLRTSANSRFPNRWVGMVLSFPRHQNDFTMKMYRDAIQGKSPEIFAKKWATWEVNPSKKYEDYKSEIENPITSREAKAKYMCEPPLQETGFFEFPERVGFCVNKSRLQVVELEKIYKTTPTGSTMVGKRVVKYNIPRQPDGRKYVAHVDLGRVKDLCAMAIAHMDNGVVVFDLIAHWKAEMDRSCPIDVNDPAELLIKLKKELLPISFVTYDQWNSASSMVELNRAGIVTDTLSLKFEEYQLMKNLVYSKSVEFPDYPILTDPQQGELVNLVLLNGNKVDHIDGQYTNDVSEAVCGCIAMLVGTKKNVSDTQSLEGIMPSNETEVGDSLWSPDYNNNPHVYHDPLESGIGGISLPLHGRGRT